MVIINVMPQCFLYEQGEGEEERVRGEGKREGEGRKRGRGVSVVDVSECLTQSLQQDLETQPHVLPSYPLHVLLFTMTSWSNSICYTSLRFIRELT